MIKIIYLIFGATLVIAFLALPQFSWVIARLAGYIQRFNDAISPIVSPEVAFFLALTVLMFIAAVLSVIKKNGN